MVSKFTRISSRSPSLSSFNRSRVRSYSTNALTSPRHRAFSSLFFSSYVGIRLEVDRNFQIYRRLAERKPRRVEKVRGLSFRTESNTASKKIRKTRILSSFSFLYNSRRRRRFSTTCRIAFIGRVNRYEEKSLTARCKFEARFSTPRDDTSASFLPFSFRVRTVLFVFSERPSFDLTPVSALFLYLRFYY